MGKVRLTRVVGDAYYYSPDRVNNKVCEGIFLWVGVWEDESNDCVKDAVRTARELILQEGVANRDGEIINGDKTLIVIDEVNNNFIHDWTDNPFFRLSVYSRTVPKSHRVLETNFTLKDDCLEDVS